VALEFYTTEDEIRAALGVDPDELTDATLDLDMYLQFLLVKLRSISPSLPADYATVASIDEGTRTDEEAALYSGVKLFAPYAVAVFTLPALALMAQKQVTDGKAGVARFAGEPYKETMARVQAMYDQLKTELLDVYTAYIGGPAASTLRPYLSVISPSVDPVVE